MRRTRTLLLEGGLILAAIVLGRVFDSPLGYCIAAVLAISFITAWFIGRDEDEDGIKDSSLFKGNVPAPPTVQARKGATISAAAMKEHIAFSRQFLLQRLASEEKERVRSSDWKDLADRFKEISRHVGAQLQTTSELREQFGKDTSRSDRWSIGVDREEKKCEALCVLAGAMLAKSRNQPLSAEVRAVTSDRDRWLGFLRECDAVRSDGYVIEPISEDRKQIRYYGYITELAVVSANTCIECSAREI